MRHGKKVNHLSRKSEHRKAMMANMASSLIVHKRISTTVAKAKALKKYVEPLITKAKEDSTHSRRIVFSYLKKKEPVKELFGAVADKIADRPGGYTRILKTGTRLGDNAETCIIELVDFNETYSIKAPKKGEKKRTRRGGTKKADEVATPEEQVKKAPAKTKAEVVKPPVEDKHIEPEANTEIPVEEQIAEPVTEEEVITAEEIIEAPEAENINEEPSSETETPTTEEENKV
jgi:large subunit ribosomal protein L17